MKNSQNERTLAIVAHVIGLFTSFVGPLIVWLIKKDSSEYVANHSKEALNFQISIAIYSIVSMFLSVILIGPLLLTALFTAEIVLIVKAGKAASIGGDYSYPLTIRLIK